jgi:hypothetical protein
LTGIDGNCSVTQNKVDLGLAIVMRDVGGPDQEIQAEFQIK